MFQHIRRSHVEANRRFLLRLHLDLGLLLVRKEFVVIEVLLTELAGNTSVDLPSEAPTWLWAYLSLGTLQRLWLGFDALNIDGIQRLLQ